MAVPNRRPKQDDAAMHERLQALGRSIAIKRDESVAARKESGIEEIWLKCEEAYLGIDDANRHEFEKAKWAKSTSISGPVTTNGVGQDDTRSTAFVRLTSRYVDFASAKLCEIALPIDDKAFAFDPTPVPELVGKMEDESPLQDGMGQPVMQAGPDGQPVQKTVKDAVTEVLNKAKDAADKAETRIFDWMVEGKHVRAMRKVIHDGARLGAGVLKGPIPDKSKSQAIVRNNDVISLEIVEKTVPVTRWVDPWNCFPDPACGEDIHDGDYFIERDYRASKKLRDLKKLKGWNAAMIDKVLEEGPGKVLADDRSGEEGKSRKRRFELWHYYGSLNRADLEAAGITNLPEGQNEAYAIITLVNDSVIRCILNPLDSGKFPYHVFAWSRRAGHWAGVGVAEQVEMPQRGVNASTRGLFENAGISAGVQIILDRGMVTPSDGEWNITRNKIWYKSSDAVIDDVRKAFHIFEIPSVQDKLMSIIEYNMRLAEEHTSIPLVSQGQYAQNSPQTFGQADLQNTNALTLLKDKGDILDDSITESLVTMFYEWLLLDPDVPAEEKGDFKINAHGTAAMFQRAIQEVTLAQSVTMSLNPAFGADPEKAYAMWLKSKRIDPRDVQYDEEKKAEMEKNPPPPAPAIAAAQIRAQSAEKIADMNNQTKLAVDKSDTDRDTAYVNAQSERDRNQEAYLERKLSLERELALLQYANQNQVTLENAKASLAETVLKLRTTKELAALNAPAKNLPTPPVEPPGRAEPGHSYQQ
jgi:hypothetical protein